MIGDHIIWKMDNPEVEKMTIWLVKIDHYDWGLYSTNIASTQLFKQLSSWLIKSVVIIRSSSMISDYIVWSINQHIKRSSSTYDLT